MTAVNRRRLLQYTMLAGAATLSLTQVSAQESLAGGLDILSTISPGERYFPVRFWSFAALDLIALDHSIPANAAIAPGPGGSALVAGIVHAVIADAVAVAVAKPGYGPQLRTNWTRQPIDSLEAFIGGAAFDVLQFIFDGPRHEPLLLEKANLFLRVLGSESVAVQTSWGAGRTFADDTTVRSRWDAKAVRKRLIEDAGLYNRNRESTTLTRGTLGRASTV